MVSEPLTSVWLSTMSHSTLLFLLDYAVRDFQNGCDTLSDLLQPIIPAANSSDDDDSASKQPLRKRFSPDPDQLPSPLELNPEKRMKTNDSTTVCPETCIEDDPVEREKLPVYTSINDEPDVMRIKVDYPFKRTYCGGEMVCDPGYYERLECTEQLERPISPPVTRTASAPSPTAVGRAGSMSPPPAAVGRTGSMSMPPPASIRSGFTSPRRETRSPSPEPEPLVRTLSVLVPFPAHRPAPTSDVLDFDAPGNN